MLHAVVNFLNIMEKVQDLILIADRAYDGNETRNLALHLGYRLCIPPKSNRKSPWDYDKELYKMTKSFTKVVTKLKDCFVV